MIYRQYDILLHYTCMFQDALIIRRCWYAGAAGQKQPISLVSSPSVKHSLFTAKANSVNYPVIVIIVPQTPFITAFTTKPSKSSPQMAKSISKFSAIYTLYDYTTPPTPQTLNPPPPQLLHIKLLLPPTSVGPCPFGISPFRPTTNSL